MSTPKARALRSGSQPDALLTEIKGLKNAIEASKREVIATLRSDIDCLKDTIKQLTSRVVDLEEQNEELKAKCEQLSNAPGSFLENFIDECEQRRKRECNVFVTGLPEATTDWNSDEPEDHDREVMSRLLNAIDCSVAEADIKELRRVGRVAARSSRKRPLLVTFANASQKWNVLKSASRLRRVKTFSAVYVNADLTPMQQEQRKRLFLELQQRRNRNEDVVLFRNRVIRRDEIKDLKSKNVLRFGNTFDV